MSEPTEADKATFNAAYALVVADNYGCIPTHEGEHKIVALQAIADARAEGWQAANHAWQDWLEANIPDWDAMAGIDLTTLPKEPK
jgi:hypothetical protein